MLQKLKSSVENKFGKKITCQKDCKLLSNSILETSGEYLSSSTLRRVFGLLITNSNPTRVTLDILSHYIDYRDWEHFIEKGKNAGNDQNHLMDTWNIVKERSKRISNTTHEIIKRNSGIHFNKTIHRQFAEERIAFFLNSEFSSTALIGPGGYGKSTLLANWFEKNSSNKNSSTNIIVFLQAIALNSLANSDIFFENWLTRQLGLPPNNDFFSDFQNSNSPKPGKFILIIDALDESNLHGTKQEKIFSSIADFTHKFSSSSWIKIIITTRFYSWSKFRPYLADDPKWFYTEPETFSADGANMPLLTSDEIQKIIDNTINTKYSKRTLVEEFSMELRDTLAYPYFLQLFLDVYHPENEYLLNDQIEIFREFLKKQVYHSPFSEEKIDILDKILELSDLGINPDKVKKNSLKEIYPIHLKLAGNYFHAYEDLLSFGIITEEDIENKYGGHFKIVKITNQSLFEILIAKNYLEKEDKITLSLFKKVEKKYANNELLAPLINRLFQFAYKDRNIEPLKNFFELNTTTLCVTLKTPTVAITLRKDEYLRKILFPIYSKNITARKYLFEDFPDINNITGSFSFSINHYLNNCASPDEIFYSYVYNVYAGFLALDDARIERFYKQMNEFIPNNSLNPSITGKWFASKCMYQALIKGEDPKYTIKKALDCLNEFRKKENYDYVSFESAFFNALVLTNQHETLARLVNLNGKIETKQLMNRELKIYQLYSKLTFGGQIDYNDTLEIDLILTQLNPMNSFISQILGQFLKASYYLTNNEMIKAYDCYRNSIELSNLAGYRIAEVKLMKNLSKVLLQLGEKTKSIECNNFAESLTLKTGFNYSAL